jgi:putative ABC transport system permease protein
MTRLAGRLRAMWFGFTGTGAAASTGLAFLAFVCMFIALGVPRASVTGRNRALQEAFADSGQLGRSAIATASPTSDVTAPLLAAYWPQIADSLRAAGVRVAPESAGWSGYASPLIGLLNSEFQMELAYRSTLGSNARLIAGTMPTKATRHGATTVFQVAVTQATAASMHLRVGSTIDLLEHIVLSVTAIIRPNRPADAFWSFDPLLAATTTSDGGAFIGASEATAVGYEGALMSWDFPLVLRSVTVAQVPALMRDLASVEQQWQPQSVTVTSALDTMLPAFLATDAGISTVLALLFVSLAVLGLIVVLQGTRLLAEHRAAEFAILRARGASLRQLSWLSLRGGSVVVIPAAVLAAVAAAVIWPHATSSLQWQLAAILLVAAVAGPPFFTLRQHQRSRNLTRAARTTPSPRVLAARRWVADIGLGAVAVGSLIVLRQAGPPPAGGVNIYASAAPALAAIPAAVVAMRLYPFVLRWLLRTTRGRRGVTVFVGLARGERTALSTALPVFALVLAMAIVGFAATMRTAVQRGDVLASWQDVGADAVITAQPGTVLSAQLQRAVAAVPGVQRTATAVITSGSAGQDYSIPVVIVNPAQYGALVGGTPAPSFPAAALTRPAATASARSAVPVLVSAAAQSTIEQAAGQIGVPGRALRVRVAGVVTSMAVAPGGPFVVVPAWAVRAAPPNAMAVVGPAVAGHALASAVSRGGAPAPSLQLRSAQLAELSSAPLPQSGNATLLLVLAATAGFSVLSLLLGLILGARSRALTQARLATMGMSRRQARLQGIVESVPAIIVAAAGGIACATALTPLLATAISLSPFISSNISVPFLASPVALAGSAVALLALAVLTIVVQVAMASHRGAARALRVGE